jgi:hypothetical protein
LWEYKGKKEYGEKLIMTINGLPIVRKRVPIGKRVQQKQYPQNGLGSILHILVLIVSEDLAMTFVLQKKTSGVKLFLESQKKISFFL